jgi:uncharacterized repeat protein (TIGR02543 family)
LISRKPATRRLLAGLSIAALTLTGIGVSSIPAAANDTKAMTITGFAPNSTVLTKAMRVKINKFIKKNSSYEFVTCVGFADRPGSARANSNLGKARAMVGCNHALKRNSDLEIASTRGRWDDTQAGSNIRRVRIILSNSATAQLTTYFEYMGGEKGIESVRTTAGGSIVLPTPTRAGYQFLGWFTDQYNGTKVGNGGESYTPTRTRILWAQWFVPASSGGGTSSNCSPAVEANLRALAEDGPEPFYFGAQNILSIGEGMPFTPNLYSALGFNFLQAKESSFAKEEFGSLDEVELCLTIDFVASAELRQDMRIEGSRIAGFLAETYNDATFLTVIAFFFLSPSGVTSPTPDADASGPLPDKIRITWGSAVIDVSIAPPPPSE